MRAPKKRGRKTPLPGRALHLGNRKTSVRLEAVMWDALTDIAADQRKTVYAVLYEIDRDRGEEPLSSAIRVYIVGYYRAALSQVKGTRAGQLHRD